MHVILAGTLRIPQQQVVRQLRGELLAFPVGDARSALAWHRENVRVDLPSAERWWRRAPASTSWLAIFHSAGPEPSTGVQSGEGFRFISGDAEYRGTVLGLASVGDARSVHWILLAGDGDIPAELEDASLEEAQEQRS